MWSPHRTACALTSLPASLLSQVLGYLRAGELALLCSINRQFRIVVDLEARRLASRLLGQERKRLAAYFATFSLSDLPVHVAFRRYTAWTGYHGARGDATRRASSGFATWYLHWNPGAPHPHTEINQH